jgi:hypothetical protein
MKKIKYLGAGICMLLALSQMVPIYLIASGLIQGQGAENTSYFIGKLLGHIFVTVLVLLIASKLIKSVIAQNNSNASGA